MDAVYNINYSFNDWEQTHCHLRHDENTFVDVCFYKIIRDAKFPFLVFFLQKTSSNSIDFARIHLHSLENTTYLQNTLLSFIYPSIKYNTKHVCPIRYVHTEHKLFIDVSDLINHTQLDPHAWVVALPHEITNQGHVSNAIISPSLTRFVTRFPESMMLCDSASHIIEMPSIGYKKASNNCTPNYLLTFGCTKSFCKKAELGPYYFFDTECDSDELIICVKFALFLGHTFHAHNPERLNWFIDNKLLWSSEFSSILVGDDDSTKNLIGLKEYEQQYPL